MPKFSTGRYAAIGYVVSKVVLPLVRRRMKKRVRSSAVNSTKASARAARNNPARTSIAVGSAVGAVGFLLRRKRRRNGDDSDS